MTNPLAFLTAALDAAQRDAEAAAERAWSPRWEYDDSVHEIRDLSNGNTLANIYHPEIGNYVAANEPAATLRRIAADRKLIAEHLPIPDHGRFSNRYGEDCPDWCEGACHGQPKVCRSCRDYAGDPIEAPCPTVRNMAEGWGWTGKEEGLRRG